MSKQFKDALLLCTDPKMSNIWVTKDVIATVYDVCRTNADEAKKCAAVFNQWLMHHYDTFPSVLFTEVELNRSANSIRNATLSIADATEPNQRWLATSPAGNEIVTHFAQREMCNTQVCGHLSANELWRLEKDRVALLASLFKCRRNENLCAASLRNAAKFRHILPSGFAPLLIKTVIDRVIDTDTKRTRLSVLDPCAGWGHRFVGFWGSQRGGHYVGVDPNVNMHPIYSRLSLFLLSQSAEDQQQAKTCQFLCLQAESSDFCDRVLAANAGNQFDLAFTCPPYFDVEKYTTSHAQLPSYEMWRDQFLSVMMQNSSACLRPGGYLALVVKDCPGCMSLCHDTRYIAVAHCKLIHKHTIRLCLTYQKDAPTHEFLFIFVKPVAGTGAVSTTIVGPVEKQ